MVTPASAPVVLFDGTCNFCDGVVHFVLDHERGSSLKFAALQSDVAGELLRGKLTDEQITELRAGATGSGDPDSVVFIEGGLASSPRRVRTHSSAALAIAGFLRWPWSMLRIFWLVPRPLRDLVYRWFARNRYRWFGKTDACRLPTPKLAARFLV